MDKRSAQISSPAPDAGAGTKSDDALVNVEIANVPVSASRRRAIKRVAAVGAATLAGPAFISNAFSSSGELNLLRWSDEVPAAVIDDFTKKTGIKVNTTPFGQNEELINKMMATEGEGFDLCMPSSGRSPQFKELELLQPFDTSRLKIGDVVPAMMENSIKWWTWKDKLYHIPHVWGSEMIGWRTDQTALDYKTLSYGTLWDPQYRGKMQGRPHSLLLGIGLWMDASGKLPSNRMLDSYKDEPAMRKIYDPLLAFALQHKSQIKQFWDNADSTKSGFMTNGCTIGQTWDGPVIALLKQGKPVRMMAPQEGAIAWVDGWSLSKGAANKEQAYAWLNFLYTKEVNAKVAELTGYNTIIKGADGLLSEQAKTIFRESYPGDAINKLWHRVPEPTWYATIRNEYAEKFQAA